jgi:DNA-binding response OmpR family regulator
MGRSVLVADDDLVTQKILRITLECAGYEVTAVCDGEETLRVLEGWVPDVVILDVMMPKLDGFSVLRRIRDDPRTARIPVVLLTGRSSPDDLWRGWQEGVDYYLTKPFDSEELLRFMDRTVARGAPQEAPHPAPPYPAIEPVAEPVEPVAGPADPAEPASGPVEPEPVVWSLEPAGRVEPAQPAEQAEPVAGFADPLARPVEPVAGPVEPEGAAEDSPAPAAIPVTATAMVLVADDDPSIHKVLRLNLELEGYTVASAFNGEEALERLAEARPDLVVLDVMMPALDGLEVLRRIRANAATADLPVILLTARSAEEDMWEGWQLGVDYYLTKPFDIEELLRTMERLIAGRPPTAGS